MILLVFLTVLWLGAPGRADPGLKFAAFDFFPWSYDDAAGNRQGITIDVVAALSRQLGQPITAERVSVARAFRDVKVGAVDFVLAYRDSQMVPGVTFVGDIGCLKPNVTLHRSKLIRDLEGLAGKRIGFVAGGFYDVHYRGQLATEDVLVNSVDSMIKMLTRGRLDGFVVNDGILAAYRSRGDFLKQRLPEGWQEAIGNSVQLSEIPVSIAMSIDAADSPLARRMTEAIGFLHQNGGFRKVMQSWGAKDGWNCG